MKKLILFILLDQYADWEAAYLSSAIHMLGGEVYAIKTVGLTKEPIKSIGGFSVMPDYGLESMPEAYEALILIGGLTWRGAHTQPIKPVVEKCMHQGKVLGGICDASGFLGTIGALNHVKHTSNDINDLKDWAGAAYTGEANYIREQAVSDGNIITANGTAALEFAKEVMLTLKVASEDDILEWYHLHKLGYYNAPLA